MSTSIPSLSTNSTASAVDQLVSQYTQSISTPVYQLQAQQSTLNSQITFYQDFLKKLTSLQTQASGLAQIGTLSPLAAKTVSSSDSTIATGTAQSAATTGTHSLLVTQLAKYDTLVSSQLSQSGTDISTATGAGTYTFSVSVNGTATNVDVSVGATDTNATILANMASAVNNAGLNVTASVVNDTSSTARLVFTSKNSGSANAISVADVTGTLAQSVGWTSAVMSGRTASGSTTAGFVNGPTSSLDANFTMDGIPIVRSSNTVSDVLTGVTLNLTGTQQPSANPINMTVGSDTSAVQTSIQDFINSYNTAITTLRNNLATDSTTQVRGPFAGDVSLMNLQLSMQNIAMGEVSSVTSGNPSDLNSLGITINTDGTLVIGDQTKLTTALNSNPNAVAAVFNSTDGIAVQLNTLMKTFVGPSGVMNTKITGAQDQVSAMNDQITAMQSSINLQADAMRQQFTAYQSLLIQLNQTQSTLSNIWNGMATSGLPV
jgi:flagellar hook-associated protein 2